MSTHNQFVIPFGGKDSNFFLFSFHPLPFITSRRSWGGVKGMLFVFFSGLAADIKS